MKRPFLFSIIFFFFGASFCCAAPRSLEAVTLQLAWKHQFQFAGYYAAKAKGFYRDAGLEVTLVEGGEDTSAREQVARGKAQYGVAGVELVLHRNDGDPFIVLAAVFQHSPSILLARHDQGISEPQDLIGKKVMLLPGKNDADILSLFINQGIPLDTFSRLDQTYNLNDLLRGKVDAVSAYITNEPYLLKEQGVTPQIIQPIRYGIDFYSNCLFTTEGEIENHPKRVKKFLNASLKGWEYAMRHQEEIVDLILAEYEVEKSREHLLYEAKTMESLVSMETVPVGNMQARRWDDIVDTLIQLDLLPKNYVSYNFIYTPHQGQDVIELKIAFVVTLVVLVFVGGQLFLFYSMNRKLKHEISEREIVEKELRASDDRFRSILAKMDNISVQGYTMERRVIYWNKASEKMYGYSAEEAKGKKIEDLIIPEAMQAEVITSIRDWLEKGREIPSSEIVLRHKDGSEVPVYSSHILLPTRRSEKIMYCIDVDLAELKLAQAMKQRSESLYRQLFAHSSSGVAVYDAVDNGGDFIFKDINQAGEKIDCTDKNELLGCRLTTVFPGVKDFGLLDVLRRVWKTGEPELHPVSFYCDEKLQGWRESRVFRLPTGEVVSVYDDVTKEKQLEEENKAIEMSLQRAQKMEAIGLMAGGVAHDLNNILTGVTGYPELLLRQLPEKSELRAPIEKIKDSGERAAAVVADLLTIARGVASTKKVCNLNTLVSEYLDSPEYYHLCSTYEHVQYQVDVQENLPCILCSSVHIAKCIMNLVTNGSEAIDTTGTVTLSTMTAVPSLQWARENGLALEEYVVLTVSDTGTGILEENIEHIFEPFYTKKVMGKSGTGLGLSVVWNTMEDHGGKIFVESNDQGTTFQLFFPVVEEERTAQTEDNRSGEIIGNNEHVLIIDDESQPRDIAVQMLQTLQYKVDAVSSGKSAIDFVQQTPVDLLVIDMLMGPGLNGRQTYEEIIRFNPEQKALVVSGFSLSDDVEATLQLGAGGFINKPYSIKQLGRAVKMVLQGDRVMVE